MNAQPATKTSKVRKPDWPRLYEHKVGEKIYWQVDCGLVDGKRLRFVRSTKTEAERKAAELRVARENEGRDALTMPKELRVDAGKGAALLRPYGASLADAARYYVDHCLKFREAPSVKGIVARLLADTKAAGRRDRTLRDLQGRLEGFARIFGERQLTSITLPELQAWINDPGLAARSRINNATKLSQLWNFAIRHSWAESNLVEKITRPDPEDGEPGILTIPQAAELLENAERFGLLSFVALGLFAGLRQAELMRLDWAAVKLTERVVIVGAEVAKKRSRRVVDIPDALAAWLSPCVGRKGPVVDATNFRKNQDALRTAAGIKEWPHNALRHSFGSYHLAMFGDAVRTAAQMGHRDVGVLHASYKALVTKQEAERFWALRPGREQNVIALSKSA